MGWFGPYFSLGQWAGIEEPIFTSRGDYRLTVKYWNAWPYAYLTNSTGRGSTVKPWIGELVSNTVTVTVH
jgi:hypothetical protein